MYKKENMARLGNEMLDKVMRILQQVDIPIGDSKIEVKVC